MSSLTDSRQRVFAGVVIAGVSSYQRGLLETFFAQYVILCGCYIFPELSVDTCLVQSIGAMVVICVCQWVQNVTLVTHVTVSNSPSYHSTSIFT